MANNAEINLRGAFKTPPLRIDRTLMSSLRQEQKRRKLPSLASTMRVLLRERLAELST